VVKNDEFDHKIPMGVRIARKCREDLRKSEEGNSREPKG